MPLHFRHATDLTAIVVPVLSRRHAALLSALLVLSAGPLQAQPAGAEAGSGPGPGDPQRLDTVVIRAERTLEERFSATGSRVTVNRNDIEQMGADTVADVLRQLPGVQTSGGASGNLEIRMRGMDRNATQILIDGQRTGSGRASAQLPFDQLPADMIERIEVLRSPSAEYSGAAGGTINIVMRDASVRPETNLRVTDQHAFGRDGGQLFFSKTGPLNAAPAKGEREQAASAGKPLPLFLPWSYFLSVGANERLWGSDLHRDTATTSGTLTAADDRLRGLTRELTVMPRLNGRLSARDTVILRGTLLASETASRLDSTLAGQAAGGTPLAGGTRETGEFHRQMMQVRGDWTRRLEASRLELRLSGERSGERQNRARTTGLDSGAGLVEVASLFGDRRSERSAQAALKLTGTEGAHIWMGGIEYEVRRLDVDTSSEIVGQPAAERNFESVLARRVIWGQNEWGLPANTTLTAGLRGESIARITRYDGLRQDDQQTQLQPSLHTRTPLADGWQIRTNLARTRRIPALTDTIERVVPSWGGNSPSRPDTIGNPALKVESTLSLDTGVEKRLAAGGQAGLNVFVRSIDDLIIRRTTEVDGRWLQRPENLGSALVWGVESDLKTDLRALGAAGWNFSLNGSLLQSRLKDDLGYSGRIPGQAHYLLNVNVAKPIPRGPGAFAGFGLSFKGASDIGSNADSRGRERATVNADAHVGQLIAGLGFWRLGVSNLLNAKRNRERVDADSAGGTRTEQSVEQYGRRIFLTVGSRW